MSLQSPLLPHLLTLGPQGTLTPDPEPTLLTSGHFRPETGFYKERREWTVFLTTRPVPSLPLSVACEGAYGCLAPNLGEDSTQTTAGQRKGRLERAQRRGARAPASWLGAALSLWCRLHILLPLQVTEKAMAPCSSTLAWKIPRTEEPGRLQSMGSRRVGHD